MVAQAVLAPVVAVVALRDLQAAHEDVVEPQERRMIARVMRLGDRSVRGVMTPRAEVDWLDLDQDTATVLARLHRSPHSRLPAAHVPPRLLAEVSPCCSD